MNLHVIILAAGNSTRMQSAIPKVLHKLGGKSLLHHVLDAVQPLSPQQIYIVYQRELNREHDTNYPITWVYQDQLLGTAHAVAQVLPQFDHTDTDDQVLILYGDVPLIATEVLQALCAQPKPLNLLTTQVIAPQGFGRIIRDASGDITAIVEQKDLLPHQEVINEINPGIYLTTIANLQRWLPQITANNQQQEFYLTDIVQLAVHEQLAIATVPITEFQQLLGVNTRAQLMQLERYYQQQQIEKLLAQGVSIKDAARVDIRGTVMPAMDAMIDVNVVLSGTVQLGKNCIIGANCVLRDVVIGDDTVIESHCVIEESVIGDACYVGPFVHLRPNTRLADGVRIGNFVEIKNSVIGDHSKVPHLSYIGDSNVGSRVNIGAGVITVNYNGSQKFRTTIENGAFIGCDVQLIAPVTIGTGAYVAAGSTITQSVPAGNLAVCRARPQKVIARWERPVKSD